MTKSAYIHIPFCKSKCKYCSFVSYVLNAEMNEKFVNNYLDSLVKDIEVNYNGEFLETLYFGGGTPSLININQVAKILSKLNLSPNCEITFEMNPDDGKLCYLSDLKALGINRLSFGSQTFNDDVLKLIGRRHNSKDTIEAVKLAQKVGFANISLDLIYGLPGDGEIKKDLEIISNLEIQHISTYGLKIEQGSYFYKHPPKSLPDDDMQADMYLEINDFLEKRGYYRYEISNFSKKGYESKHNLNYWKNNEYYGFGVAAHGYVNGIRYSKFESLEDYINMSEVFSQSHKLSIQEKLEEEIFLGLRKEEGINIQNINEQFNIDFEVKYNHLLEKFCPKYIQKTVLGYKLTLEGILLSNNILSEFLD